MIAPCLTYAIESHDKKSTSIPQKELTSEYIAKRKELISKVENMVNEIGSFDFNKVSELNDKQHVIILNNNLKRYIEVRSYYYDSIDDLLKSYRKKNGNGKRIK